MAAPVKSNSTITGLGVKARCKAIYTKPRRAINVPKDIQAIARDLEEFNSKLGTLKQHLENRALSAGKTNLDCVLESPLIACDQLNEFIGTFKARGGVGDIPRIWRKIKYSFGGADTKAFINEIAAHRLSLNVAISLVNFININIESAATRNSDAKIFIYLTGMVDKLPAIFLKVGGMKSAVLSSIESHPPAKRLLLVETQSVEICSYLFRETATLRRIYHSSAVFMPTSIRSIPEDATQIFVKGPGKQTNVVHIKSGQTMNDLKRMIEARTGVPRDLLYFMSAGKVLPSDGTPESLNIGHDSTLICNARATGTGKHDLTSIAQLM